MVAMVAAFWSWALAVGRLNLETRGFGGRVTMALWTLYLLGVPLTGFLSVSTALLGALRRRYSWRFAASIGGVVATTVIFWCLSIMKAGG